MIYPRWPAPAGVKAVITTRRGGLSSAPYDSLNLAAHVGDDGAAVAGNRALLRQRLGLPAEPLWLDQVHGNRVVDAAAAPSGSSADASFSRARGVVCAVLSADCLFCARDGSAVAVAHAGWRGLAGGVLEATIDALQIAPERLLTWLGPAIGATVFEVGAEVREAFIAGHPQAVTAFVARPHGRWLADLYALARLRLRAAGVDAVHGGGFCTYSEPDRFYSFRRERATGRMASLIWLQ
jgi:YfiH family protein